MNMMYTKASTLALIAALLPTGGFAAETQQMPGVIDRTLPDFSIPESHSLSAPAQPPLQEAPVVEAVPGKDQVVATLRQVVFKGNTLFPEETLQMIISPYLNRPITNGDLSQLKYEVTKAYYDKGYILVKATTPPQDLTDGVLDVNVYEARVGQIGINDQGALNPVISNAMAGRVEQGDVFEEDTAESLISDIDDLPGVAASVTLKPGQQFGTTDMHIVTEQAPDEDVNYAQLDNYGSKYTGRHVATGHVEHSNMANLGEQVYATGRISDQGLWSVDVGGEVPIAVRNVKAELNYLHANSDIRKRYTGTAFEQEGETDAVVAALKSDIVNTRDVKATVRTGMEFRDHDSFVNDVTQSSDTVRQAFVQGSVLRRMPESVWYGSVKASKGLSILDGSEEGDLRLSRAGANPEAYKVEPVLLANYRVMDYGVLKFVGTGQMASDVLLSSDLFILGGYGSIRGFQPAQETGEAGWQMSVEYLHDMPVHEDWYVGFGPFLDGGAVYNRLAPTVSGVQDSHLYSAGLGVEAVSELIPGVGDTTLRADWAHTLGAYTSRDITSDTLYLRANQEF